MVDHLEYRGQQAIRQIGTNALPILIERLQAQDTRLEQWMMTWAGKQKLVPFYFKSAAEPDKKPYSAMKSWVRWPVPKSAVSATF